MAKILLIFESYNGCVKNELKICYVLESYSTALYYLSHHHFSTEIR